jgi:hypothetical protein
MSYDEQREELYAIPRGVIQTNWFTGDGATTGYIKNMPFAGTPIADVRGATWTGFDKAHDKDDETVVWPPEERINNIGLNGPTGEHYMNKYQRKLTKPTYVQRESQCDPSELASIDEDVVIDVYDVLDAFDVTNPAAAHAVKKLLCPGTRGAKDWETDLQEAIDSLERAKSFPPLPF